MLGVWTLWRKLGGHPSQLYSVRSVLNHLISKLLVYGLQGISKCIRGRRFIFYAHRQAAIVLIFDDFGVQ